MKKLLLKLSLVCFLTFNAGSLGYAFAQYDYETETAGPDSLSIDDMDPLLMAEEEEAEKQCCPGLYIGIAVVVVVAGVLVYRRVSKKKA